MINVTSPFLPPIEEYQTLLKSIWETKHLTNGGNLVNSFEKEINNKLKLNNFLFTANGTVALQLAIKALKLQGEIITTPFSFIATTSTIIWENCTPVFADIDRETLNIDPDKIIKNITKNTSAILCTHVYGNPCEVEKIETIAKNHNLKVIYDAAHCFGVTYNGSSILNFGDVSTISFHATKLFHTTEGGGIVTKEDSLKKKIQSMINFGHNGPEEYVEVGINGKNSEFHAAMGICNLKYFDEILEKRKNDYQYYQHLLKKCSVEFQKINSNSTYNYAYFPIIFNCETDLLKVKKVLTYRDINTRRYFYPTLNKAKYLSGINFNIPIAENISKRILCLPLYHTLKEEEIKNISDLIIQNL